MAALCSLLTDERSNADDSADEDDDDISTRPRKRQRLTNELDEALHASNAGVIPSRITALQTLVFYEQQSSCRQLANIVDKLSASCADDNVIISSWAFLALANFAAQQASTHASLSSRWSNAWQLAQRAMSNANTSRAACHLLLIMLRLKLVPNQAVTEFVHTLTVSIDLNGPTVLADSVVKLCAYTVQLSQQTNPTTSSATAESVLGWLFRTYTPSKFQDRAFTNQQMQVDAGDIVDLVSVCLGTVACHGERHQYPQWGPVGCAWLRCEIQAELTEYLLLLPSSSVPPREALKTSNRTGLPNSTRASCETIVLNNLISETFRTKESWSQLAPRNMSHDMMLAVCRASYVIASIALCNEFRDTRRQSQLQKQAHELLEALMGFVKTSACPQDKADAMMITFSCAFSSLNGPGSEEKRCQCEKKMCQAVSGALEARKENEDPDGQPEIDDMMDLDGAHDSQDSRTSGQSLDVQDLPNDDAVAFGSIALRMNVTAFTLAVTKSIEAAAERVEADQTASAQIVERLLSCPSYMVFAGRNILSRLPELGVELTIEDAATLMDFCLKHLELYHFERSEVALGAILDVVSSIASTWTNPANDDLYKDGLDMYEWYTSVGLPNRALSTNVQTRLASLLLQLCHIDPDYGSVEDGQSVRTSIFKLIKLGTIAVQYHVADRISAIFGLFVLANHEVMFNDLQKSLAADTEWIEGMAIRLLVFSRLASAWHSLLRQCTYYIFETAGRIPAASKYAVRSVSALATALRFDSPRKLFHIFAPQLLHTWLTQSKVVDLPFTIFQYDSLHDLLEENVSEVTAQLFIRNDDDGLHEVTAATRLTKADLFKKCFAKCLAYCISYEIQQSTSEHEGRLRAIVGGKEQVNKLAATYYPVVLGNLFLTVQNEDVDDAWLGKREHYKTAANTLAEIKSYSHSSKTLPTCQQPSFKSKYLCDQIERLCRRVGRTDAGHRWTPSGFALVARMLLDSIDDALGPLHTCLVIRRLRLLVCLAGDVALSDFQLEMLIHTLRPYLSDSQCADDVMGLLQYLFDRGHEYLKTQLPFACGTITLMILQIRKHSESRPESTTQASQHKATVDKMQTFHKWLVGYLGQCQPTGEPLITEHSGLVASLAEVQLPGNAHRDTPESSLLLLLLDQRADTTGLLRSEDRDEALLILSEHFKESASIEEDCLSCDQDCARLTQQLWQTLQLKGLGKSFTTWVAVALGRAYASTGRTPRPRSELRDGDLAAKHFGVTRSQAVIATRLVSALFLRDKRQASIADYTLRSALLSFDDANDFTVFENMLPQSVARTFEQQEHDYAPLMKVSASPRQVQPLSMLCEPSRETSLELWIQDFSLTLCEKAKKTAILSALIPALRSNPMFALDLFPSVVHILLEQELERKPVLRTELSACVAAHIIERDDALKPKQRYLLRLLLYLRAQAVPGETTQVDRLSWLEIDWLQAADAASQCGMPTAAILFAESAASTTQGSRRTSSRASMSQISIDQVSQDLLLSIFKEIDEPDSFYGVEQPATLESVLDRFEYEDDGLRSLMFKAAQTDTHLVQSHNLSRTDTTGMIRSLSLLGLSSLTFALLSGSSHAAGTSDDLLHSARKLQQWDVAVAEVDAAPATSCFTLLQQLSRTSDRDTMRANLDSSLLDHLALGVGKIVPSPEWFGALASVVEVGELIGSGARNTIRSSWERMQSRQEWMQMARFEDISLLQSNRQILFSTLCRNRPLMNDLKASLKDAHAVEIEALLSVSASSRQHSQLQESLSAVSQAGNLIAPCEDLGLKVAAAVKSETASVLWESQEATASVKMIRDALQLPDLERQDIEGAGESGLLARLAHQLAEARLETPENILSHYLQPAIQKLKGRADGAEAGEVFYEFATFCDGQLQNPGNIEDLQRAQRLRQKKEDDVNELANLMGRSRSSHESKNYQNDHRRAKQWLQIDDAEYQRLKTSRDTFVQQSLLNYMLALRATNKHDISVLRLFALWLESADVPDANKVAGKHLPGIPSWKFVLLMNQLMSRLEQDGSQFQSALSALVYRICADHPHHSLHHLYAATRKHQGTDQAAISRQSAASDIRVKLSKNPERADLLANTFKADNLYNALASEDSKKQDSQVSLDRLPSAARIRDSIPRYRIPPITISIPLRPNSDYSDVPVVTKFGPNIRMMSGNSRPKKLTVYASNGQQYSQLFKDGDDLRQDAIMEQVFEEVSKMLRNHKATRQRNLNVRTYKVIPLGSQTGVIEFVPNSTSFSDFLQPAHERYHPQDWKNGKARGIISAAKELTIEGRIKEFRKVCEHMQPVMRHFFFERFNDPDEWFEKRTAYTRTTATISILGYVLGLGDRHCQNIMLDEKTGEVVHIDLGIAFEAGRVLPIPELVPFRLSRDVVDGFGITKTEGVFRRCCEFTMDALREDKGSIMTLLNVLRYDPLYTWSVSPLRAKRMQEQTVRDEGSKKKDQEAGEADRALSIVEKKLSKTLSTAATVNELIQQAMDEKNLATLFSGWSAWL